MRFWIFFSLQIGCISFSLAHVEPTYYLQGHIGKREVGVQIDHFMDVSYLKYFLVENKRDVILKGQNDSSTFYFEKVGKDSNGMEVVQESIVINHLSEYKWDGFWVSGNDSLRIFLTPIVVDAVKHKYASADTPNNLDPYGYLRTSTLRLKKEKVTRLNGYKIRWLKEPISGSVSFQAYKKKDRQMTKKLNQWLMNQQLASIENYFICGTYGFRGTFDSEVKIQFLSDDLISYNVNTHSACFSQSQTEKTEYFTLNVHSGYSLSLEEVFFLGDTEVPKVNTREWFEYRRKCFSISVKDKMKSLYPEYFTGNQDCDFDNIRAWQQPVWYLTEKGLYLGAVFPGIDKSCNEPDWAVIPYHDLINYSVVDF